MKAIPLFRTMLVAFVATCTFFVATSCSDDSEEKTPTPGTITAVTDMTSLSSYASSGNIQFIVRPSNSNVKLDADNFGFSTFSMQSKASFSEKETSTSNTKLFNIVSASKNGDGTYTITAEYDYTSLTGDPLTINATLSYTGTNTKIPMKFTCYCLAASGNCYEMPTQTFKLSDGLSKYSFAAAAAEQALNFKIDNLSTSDVEYLIADKGDSFETFKSKSWIFGVGLSVGTTAIPVQENAFTLTVNKSTVEAGEYVLVTRLTNNAGSKVAVIMPFTVE